MIPLQSYVNQSRSLIRKLALSDRVHEILRVGWHLLSGFCLSAASLGNFPLPLAMGLTCALSGGGAFLTGLGGSLGYWFFWRSTQGILWTGLGLTASLILGRLRRETPLLLPAAAGLTVAVLGLMLQEQGAHVPGAAVYLAQVGLAMGSTWVFSRSIGSRDPLTGWLSWGLAVLALCQILPIPGLGLGYLAAGYLASAGAFPAAALSGLALDLGQVTAVPMTAVLVLSWLPRFVPRLPKVMRAMTPGFVYITVMSLVGVWDLMPLGGLLLGGAVGAYRDRTAAAPHRRGETGAAQVHLELAAGVLAQAQQVLLECSSGPVDEDALVSRAAERACGTCSGRRTCKDAKRLLRLPGHLLHKPLLAAEELPIVCKKSGRFLAELHRSQEQLRSIRADRDRQGEYRAAVTQQYGFLSEYLQTLSDQLTCRTQTQQAYTPQVLVYGNRPEGVNGDRCLRFSGVGCRYYVLLCDGMGTGLGAVREGREAGVMLRRLLSAGFPAENALKSLNSLCALRERAGAVTVDLCELELDTGRATLYKWGAAPSLLIGPNGAERLGTATPPPGLSVTDCREQVRSLTLRRGELLVLVSDGVYTQPLLDRQAQDLSPQEVGRQLLELCPPEQEDDATAVVIRLKSGK